jgi:hypothetical protein
MYQHRSLLYSCVLLLATSLPAVAHAQWQRDGVAICNLTGDQEGPAIVAAGSGGVIIAWQDARVGAPEIFAQRLDATGINQWAANGIPLTSLSSPQYSPVAVSDGTGGAIVAWLDDRNGFSVRDVYAQRVNSSGIVQWGPDGVAVCTANTEQTQLAMVPDGTGGVIIAWRDERTGSTRTFAQRLNAAGAAAWLLDGIAVTPTVSSSENICIAPDGTGGAIVGWVKPAEWTIYAQRYDFAGAPQWTPFSGVLVFGAPGADPTMVSDDAGGVIVAFHTYLTVDSHVIVQRLDASGAIVWPGVGQEIGERAGVPVLIRDGSGGAVVSWPQYAPSDTLHVNADIFVQRINEDGVTVWDDERVVSDAPGGQDHMTAAPDGSGGALIAWQDTRHGEADIYAQRITGSGEVEWIPDGVVLCMAVNDQEGPAIATVGTGQGVVAWRDIRNNVNHDIYAQEAIASPTAVSVAGSERWLAQNRPNPFNPTTTIRFALPSRDHVRLVIYDAAGSLVRTLLDEVRAEGSHEVEWDGRNEQGTVLSSGVYFAQLTTPGVVEARKMMMLK